jgi:hypothetical protein
MDHFWPTLPLTVPNSEGIALWWDIAWWVFQIVVMVILLTVIARWAVRVDKDDSLGESPAQPADNSEQPSIQG